MVDRYPRRVSFVVSARRVRNVHLPYRHRVAALRSCVWLYPPIGFDNTLRLLEEIAGPFQTDESALLMALDALTASRAARKIATSRYAEARREAKRNGQQCPRPNARNPHTSMVWYGDVRRGALHVLRREQPELSRLGHACGIGSVEAKLSKLADQVIQSNGEMAANQIRVLSEIMEMLGARLADNDLYRVHIKSYRHVSHLLQLGRLIEDASIDDVIL